MFRSSMPKPDIVLFEMIDQQSDADGQAYLDALADLAGQPAPVILIFRISGLINQDHEIRKQAAVWFKQNRDRLTEFAKGFIRVDEGHHHGDEQGHDDHAEHVENTNFARMLPFPVKHAPSLDAAFDMAREWPLNATP
ncbi:hypothetical protein [Thalassospira australica]|uniref:hypothetical protein n=1 Tax=Thalassospira australica TaxID=1528106 RepID=UPI00051A4B70|nr:hypothetical protein [Thalassospira australica]